MTQANGMKNMIIQVTYFSKAPMVNVALLSYIERKCFLKRNLATILPLKSKLSGKFQSFNTIDGSIGMLKNSWISQISIKMKKFKTFYKVKTVSHLKKIIHQTPNKWLSFSTLGKTKVFLQKFTGL